MTPYVNGKAYCPMCHDYFPLLGVTNAAKLANVNRKTVYRYIESGLVHCLKVVGKTFRICSGCLLKPADTL